MLCSQTQCDVHGGGVAASRMLHIQMQHDAYGGSIDASKTSCSQMWCDVYYGCTDARWNIKGCGLGLQQMNITK